MKKRKLAHQIYRFLSIIIVLIFLLSCNNNLSSNKLVDPDLVYKEYTPNLSDRIISRSDYLNKLQGFWLGECIANWTGLVTEMDKIGGDGKDGKGAGFYTREDWGGSDQPNIWGGFLPQNTSQKITYIFEDEGGIWGADDDTDIEYIYQHLMHKNKTTKLTAQQIKDGWLTHIYSDENTPFTQQDGVTKENFLWVSNQTAHDLMRDGLLPPETSYPDNNPNYEMIDAQLTTEIFGFFAPARPDIALDIAHLPIRTTARYNAEWISEFYVIMYSLASSADESLSMKEQLFWMAEQARQRLPEDSYSAKMYDYVRSQYEGGVSWEEARDALHVKYQVNQEDGYDWSTRDENCNGCFAAGINFGASLVSLFYGEGDIKETIKIGALAGWDSDNPTATWGGLLGFMLGREGVEKAFGRKFADQFNIHRTRGGFPNNGIDNFENMAKTGVFVVDRIVQERMNGGIDLKKDLWYIPEFSLQIEEAKNR